MLIDKPWLLNQQACASGLAYFEKQFPTGEQAPEVVERLINDNRFLWADWLLCRTLSPEHKALYVQRAAQDGCDWWFANKGGGAYAREFEDLYNYSLAYIASPSEELRAALEREIYAAIKRGYAYYHQVYPMYHMTKANHQAAVVLAYIEEPYQVQIVARGAALLALQEFPG